MRIHQLEVTAFGPFADRQVLDLDRIGEAGLFLIAGPTGSGKTSLLDAVSFALFGQVPGTRDAKQLKSQHAAPEVCPEVVLDVTLRARRLRIRRTPAFSRPGRKTPVPATITLDERVDGRWTHVTGRLDEAGRVLEDVLGMTLEQFHRVVVLPQGAFAAFLHAKDEERGDLLRRLFDVQTYADVQDWLAQECRQLESRVRDASRDLDQERRALERVLGTVPEEPSVGGSDRSAAAGVPEGSARPGSDPAPWGELSPSELVTALAELAAQMQEAEVAALAATDLAEASLTQAQQALDEGARRAGLRERGLAARTVLARLEEGAEEHAEQSRVLDAAERAARVEGYQQALEQQQRRHDATHDAAEQAARALPPALVLPEASPDAALAGWIATLDAQDERADELGHLARAITETAEALPRLDDACAAAAQALAEIGPEREAAWERAEAAEQAFVAVQEARTRADELARDAAALAPLLTARLELDRLDQDHLPTAREALRAATAVAAEAIDVHRGLLRSRLDDMAGELAEQLSDGEPCLVCGSREHPLPATRHAAVSDDDLATAEAAWRAGEDEVTTRKEELAGLTARRDQARAALADDERSGAELQAAVDEIAARRDEAGSTASRLGAAAEALESVRAALEGIDVREADLTRRLTGAEARRAAAQERLGDAARTARELVEEHARDCVCVDGSDLGQEDTSPAVLARAVRSAHRRARTAATTLRDARATAGSAAQALADAKTERDSALAAEGFADADEMLAARLRPAERDHLARALTAREQERVSAQGTLDDEAVTAALEARAPDLPALTEARDEARGDWQSASRAQTHAQLVVRELVALQRRVVTLVDDLGPLEARRDLVRELAELTAGRGELNVDGISLTTYVLATRLERIVSLANERLAGLADARYELAVDHGRADRRSRGGLGLQVLDQWTGEHRPVKTLSGGETFMVALALALGTADAVREEAGGVELQTLFIDEGFGSLDETALEQVMAVLDDLRAGGRAVGVISHVADMAQRIPAQVRITKTAVGSTVQIISDIDDAA